MIIPESKKPKFAPGNVVYFVMTVPCTKYEPCDVCEATGSIKIKGKEFPCPQCHCERNYDVTTYNDKVIKGTIAEVIITWNKDGGKDYHPQGLISYADDVHYLACSHYLTGDDSYPGDYD